MRRLFYNPAARARSLSWIVPLWVLAASLLPAHAFKFAWLSDTHVSTSGGNPAADLRASVDDINAQTNLDFVLVTGDVTELGTFAQLALARDILAPLRIPCHVLPGNHDTKWSESGGTDIARLWGADRFVFAHGGYLFIGLHQGPLLKMGDGHWAPEDVRWLDDVLNGLTNTGQPIVFVTHYPLDNSIDNWFEVLDRLKRFNTQVALCGHGHTSRAYTFEGLPGVMGRSNLRGTNTPAAYNIVDVSANQMTFAERSTAGTTAAPWHTVALGKRAYGLDPTVYSRPGESLNTNYPNVTRAWRFASGRLMASSPAVWKDVAIIGDSSGAVYALRLDNGRPRWTSQVGAAVFSTPEVADDLVYVAATDGTLRALEAATGRDVWRAQTPRPIVGCPRAGDHAVFVGGSDGAFRAFERHTGKALWTYRGLMGFVETRPLLWDGKVIFGAWDACLYALDAADGHLVWKWFSNTATGFSPAACWPVEAQGKIFVAAPDRWLTAVDGATGQTVWRTNTWQVRESVGVSEDGLRVYARTMSNSVVAVAAAATAPQAVWTLDAGFGYDINSAQLVEKDGVVFYGTKNGLLLAMDAQTGALRWRHKLGNTIVHTVVPLAAGRVLAADFDGNVTLVRVANE